MNPFLKKSLADVFRRKGRTLFVVLGIFIGVCSLTSITMIEDTLVAAFNYSVGSQANQPDIVMNVKELDTSLLPALRSSANVRAVQYETSMETLWHVSRAPGYISMKIKSYPDLQHVAITPFELVSGHYPGPGEIVMEYGDGAIQAIQPGDFITIDTTKGTARLRVAGLARTPGTNPATSDNALGYMSAQGLQSLAAFPTADHPGRPTRLNFIDVKLAAGNQAATTSTELQNLLRSHHMQVLFTAFPSDNTLPLRQFSSIFLLLRLLGGLAVAISSLLIFNTLTMLLVEQTAIIGTLKAIGGTRWRIMSSYLTSVIIYCLLATLPAFVIGVGVGWYIAAIIAATIPLALGVFVIPLDVCAYGLLVGMVIPLLAALGPIWNGTRVTVHAAFAGYGISSPTHSQPKRLRLPALGLSQVSALGLRSLLRKRWRTLLMLMVLAFVGSGFLIVQTLADSVNATVSSVYAPLSADVEVDVDTQDSYSQTYSQLQKFPNIQHMERYGVGGASTIWGKLDLWGYEPDTQLYHYQLTGGRWLRPGDANVVLLSDDALARSGLHIGDALSVTAVTGANNQVVTWTIIGTVKQTVDSIGQIGAAIVPVNTLYQFQGVPATVVANTATRILIQTQDHSQNALNKLTDRIGALALADLQNGSVSKGGGISNTFLLKNEALRLQRSWYGIIGLFYGGAIIIGIVGALALANELAVSVLERQKEVGLLRAMGASSLHIARVFWTSGLTLAGAAWILGSLLGLPLANLFLRLFSTQVIPVSFQFSPLAFGIMLLALALIATLASVMPAYRGARMRIAAMLRYE